MEIFGRHGLIFVKPIETVVRATTGTLRILKGRRGRHCRHIRKSLLIRADIDSAEFWGIGSHLNHTR